MNSSKKTYNIGQFKYSQKKQKWIITTKEGKEVRELNEYETIEIQPYDEEDAPWILGKVCLEWLSDKHDNWYIKKKEKDMWEQDILEFDLLNVKY